MKNKTSSLFLADPSFDSKDFPKKFSDRRSWEPGWLADYRKKSGKISLTLGIKT